MSPFTDITSHKEVTTSKRQKWDGNPDPFTTAQHAGPYPYTALCLDVRLLTQSHPSTGSPLVWSRLHSAVKVI